MKILVTIFFLIGYSVVNSCCQINFHANSNLIADVNYLFQRIERIHPNMNYSLSKADFEKEFRGLKEKINNKMNIFDYWKLVNPLVVKLNDGHTNLIFPSYQLKGVGSSLFPFSVNINPKDSIVAIEEDYTPSRNSIPLNSRVLSINGMPINKIIDDMLCQTSGETISFKLSKLKYFFTPFLYALYRDMEFEVEYFIKGEKHKLLVQGISYEDRYQKKNANPKPYTLFIDEKNSIAIIDFRQFLDLKKFDVFLDSAFTLIHKKNINNLIIDVRLNGGGSSSLGDAMFQYISKTPFHQYGYIINKKEGKLKIRKTERLIKLRRNKLRFKGDVYVLQSNFTFSSASDFTWAFKYFKMGKIVGEESGGLSICYGETINSTLPYSKLEFGVSSKKFYNYGASENMITGTIPDYYTPSSEALDFAIQLIKAKNK